MMAIFPCAWCSGGSGGGGRCKHLAFVRVADGHPMLLGRNAPPVPEENECQCQQAAAEPERRGRGRRMRRKH